MIPQKQLKSLLIISMLLLCSVGAFSQQIELTFENAEIVDQGSFFTYEVDVFIASDSDFKLGSGQVYLNYNTAAFGNSVFTNGNITISQPDGSILGQVFGFPAYRDFITNDNTPSRVSFAFQQGVSSGTIPSDNVTSTPTQLFHMSMVMVDNMVDPGVCYESGDLFDDQFFTACGPAAVGFPNCTDNPGTQITNDNFDCSGAAPAGCQAVTTWNGSSWDNGAPSATKNAIIDGYYETADTGSQVSFTACSLLVTDTGVLIIGDGDYVTVENDITTQASGGGLVGAIVVQPGASLVQVNDDAEVVNGGEIYVYTEYTGLNNRDFVIAGSPFNIIARDDVNFIDFIQFRHHNTNNFTPNAAVAAFDPLATNFADEEGDNWLNHTGVINPGEGYLMMPQTSPTVPDNQSYTFIYRGFSSTNNATLNNGVINFDVIFGDDQNDSPNILANPYASPIDADLLTAQNSALFDTYFFWEHISAPSAAYPGYNGSNYDMGDISMYSPGSGGVAAANGGAIPDKYIAVGEGFAVKAKASGTAVFNNSMRVNNASSFKSAPLGKDRIWLNVTDESYALASQTLIAFVEGATVAYESFYDATRLATPVSLYSVLNTGEELAIQGRQAFEINDEVALGFRSQIAENNLFTISIAQLEAYLMDETVAVFLKDQYTGTVTNLSERNYSFNSNSGTYNDRFVLFFQEKVLDVDSVASSDFGIYPNPSSGIFNLETGNAQVEKVELLDLNGRTIMTFQAQKSYNVGYLETAVYFVRIYTDQGMQIKRLIKN
ncbi:T9SS type A sorting domain-containing protein [Gilvibacter sp.]|uniref:T9SS type A sorting domain-containing protein n=1 Tax=Gilvibacter sp. TaxID=2729997 RepID=UPI003F49F8CF